MSYWLGMLKRKGIAASITSSLYALFFVFISKGPYTVPFNRVSEHLDEYFTSVHFYGMYILGFVFSYGILSSVLIESFIVKCNLKPRMLVSAIGHCFFGMIFSYYSLIPAVLFFIIDQLTNDHTSKRYKLLKVISFAFPLAILFGSQYLMR